MARKYDFIIFGASGFTGQYVVEEAARTEQEEGGFSWAVAGRNVAKLQAVLTEAGKHTGKVKNWEGSRFKVCELF